MKRSPKRVYSLQNHLPRLFITVYCNDGQHMIPCQQYRPICPCKWGGDASGPRLSIEASSSSPYPANISAQISIAAHQRVQQVFISDLRQSAMAELPCPCRIGRSATSLRRRHGCGVFVMRCWYVSTSSYVRDKNWRGGFFTFLHSQYWQGPWPLTMNILQTTPPLRKRPVEQCQRH
jgi:hypothetical protein